MEIRKRHLKSRLIAIVMSILISIIATLICFYKYSDTISDDYIARTKEESVYNSYINTKLIGININNTINKIKIINKFYFKDISQINDQAKQGFYKEFNKIGEIFIVYSIDELKEYITGDEEIISKIKNQQSILYKHSKGIKKGKIEIFVPIKNSSNNLIGFTSKIFEKSEFLDFLSNNNFEHKFTTYIFDKFGNVILGDNYFKDDNVFETLKEIELPENYSLEIIQNKIKNRETFDFAYSRNKKGYIAFLRPLKEGYFTVEVMPLKYVSDAIKRASNLLMIFLLKVIGIIAIQICYLSYIIITQTKNLLKAEDNKNKEMNTIINSVPGGVIKMLCDNHMKIIFANDGFYNLTGYNKSEYISLFGDNQDEIIHKEDRQNVLNTLMEFSKNKVSISMEYRIIKKDGEISWASLTGEYLEEIHGVPIYQCIVIDSTEYKNIFEELEIEKEQYAIISEISDEIIFEYDINSDFIKISDKYRETFDIDLPTSPFIKTIFKKDFIHKEDFNCFIKNLAEIRNGKNIFRNEVRIKNNSGGYNWALYQGVAIKNNQGNIYKVVGKISNIDKFKKEIEELKEKSNRDPLTKVYNKVAVENIVNDCFKGKVKLKHALFIIDIDNFKAVNDTFGHVFGDAVLKEITANINKVFNEGETIARIGGDEFVVFLQNIKEISQIDEKANILCQLFRKTYMSENRDYKISASVGISLYPDDGNTYSEMLEKADIAVYNAKNEGKDRYKIYSPNMNHISLLNIQNRFGEDDEIRNVRRKSIYENILIDISEMFLEVKDIRTTINLILSTLCKTFDISRAYIFEVSNDGKYVSNTYEWCEDGIEPLIEKNQNIPFDPSEYIEAYYGEAFLYYSDIDILEREDEEIFDYIIQKDDIKSFFSCYFMEHGKIRGYVGFESYRNKYNWQDDELEGAFVVSRLIGDQILKDKTQKKFDLENKINKAIVTNQHLYTYIVKEDTFEILYKSENISDIMPNAQVGEICYKFKGYNFPCHECPINQSLRLNILENTTTKHYCKFLDRWLGVTANKIKLADEIDAYMICTRDISEYIEQINYIDSLTGAPTLNKFKIQSNNILNNNKNNKNTNYAILYIDIDKFKYINDTFGYVAGDRVLKDISLFLNEVLEDDEIFCRAGDDRFLAIIKYRLKDEFDIRIDNIYKKIENMQTSNYKKMKVTVICGIYMICDDEYDINTAIDKANIARKSIKGSHQNAYSIYTKKMQETMMKEKVIEGRMRYAIENNEFLPYLQPKFNLFTREAYGAEVLVRWQQEDGDMIYPNDFIPIFEKNGFIVNLDFYIYEVIFKKINQWIKMGVEPIPISLNVSPTQLNDIGFADRMFDLIKKHQVPIEFVELELTESIFSLNIKNLKGIMKKLSDYGFKLSIDDFGSAYSSLNLLKEVSVDIIKLDKGFLYNKEFLKNNELPKKDRIIIEYIVKMAKDLGIKVVCEGIETETQIDFLKKINCEMGQGYLYSKPIPLAEFEQKYLF